MRITSEVPACIPPCSYLARSRGVFPPHFLLHGKAVRPLLTLQSTRLFSSFDASFHPFVPLPTSPTFLVPPSSPLSPLFVRFQPPTRASTPDTLTVTSPRAFHPLCSRLTPYYFPSLRQDSSVSFPSTSSFPPPSLAPLLPTAQQFSVSRFLSTATLRHFTRSSGFAASGCYTPSASESPGAALGVHACLLPTPVPPPAT